jgi:hypothetical protein
MLELSFETTLSFAQKGLQVSAETMNHISATISSWRRMPKIVAW